MFILLFAGFAFLGGIISALLGWLGSGEPFVGRKFAASVIKAFVAAIVAIGGGAIIPPVGLAATIALCAAAFLSGIGVDAGLKRAVNAIAPPSPPS